MTAQDKAKLADRMKREARADRAIKIVRFLDALNETTQQILARIDVDFMWWDCWRGALGIGARCPSHETRAAVRETIRGRLPELYALTAEDRDLLAHLEAAREAACGEQWREPDMDTAEDTYDR